MSSSYPERRFLSISQRNYSSELNTRARHLDEDPDIGRCTRGDPDVTGGLELP